MTTLPRAMKSSALLTKGGNIDQYLSALASWYANIHYQWKLLKEYPTFLTQNCCWGVRLVLWHDSGSNWNWPSVNTGKCRVTFQELKSPVPEFHNRLRQSPRVPQLTQRVPEFHNRHKTDSNQWKIIHRMVCRGNIKMTEPLARPLLPRAARV